MSNEVIYAAIIAVTKKVGMLGKAAFNPHGQYKYVSIDAYYQAVGQAAAEEGLTWVLVQDSFVLHPTVGRAGVVEISYLVNVYHESGACIESFTKTSIIHPLQGAQTVGSAMSYADKVFQRQLFKIATGEEDADATDRTSISNVSEMAKNKPETASGLLDEPTAQPELPTPPDGGTSIEETIKTFVPDCGSLEVLHNFYRDNIEAIELLKKRDPAKHKSLMDAFIRRKQELSGQSKETGNVTNK